MQKLLAFLQLCRFAAVFTAMADIFLGYLLAHQDGFESERDFGLLLGSSAFLYLAGMVFNDVFDRQDDVLERPKRPLPSGRISVREAVSLGTCLVVLGFTLSCAVGIPSAIVAGLLTGCIFLYDGVLKSTPIGPLVMGGCRFLNVILGASTASFVTGESATWSMPQLAVAFGLGVYITGVTWFSRHEAGESPRWQLAGALMTVNFGLVILIGFVVHWPDVLLSREAIDAGLRWGTSMAERSWNTALALGFIGIIINRRLLAAVFDPSPAKVQASIRTMLLSIIILDASLVFFVQEDRMYAIAVALLLLPATFLSRMLAIT
jgi:4-hydroxybenzoate polyprenyltransferase